MERGLNEARLADKKNRMRESVNKDTDRLKVSAYVDEKYLAAGT